MFVSRENQMSCILPDTAQVFELEEQSATKYKESWLSELEKKFPLQSYDLDLTTDDGFAPTLFYQEVLEKQGNVADSNLDYFVKQNDENKNKPDILYTESLIA